MRFSVSADLKALILLGLRRNKPLFQFVAVCCSLLQPAILLSIIIQKILTDNNLWSIIVNERRYTALARHLLLQGQERK